MSTLGEINMSEATKPKQSHVKHEVVPVQNTLVTLATENLPTSSCAGMIAQAKNEAKYERTMKCRGNSISLVPAETNTDE